MPQLRVGTSGWNYKHWRGIFYPKDLREKEWFNFYAKYFDTVEINATFYRVPPDKTFINWNRKAPPGFLFAVKMTRIVTHLKKLQDTKESLDEFMRRTRFLGDKLGPILIQLPPSLHFDPERLETFVKILKYDNIPFAIEFRHKSWFNDDTYNILRENNVSFVIFHHPYLPCPKVITGDPVYIRFHGMGTLYSGLYGAENLVEWRDFIQDAYDRGLSVYAYFNNDFGGFAVLDAVTLKKLLKLA